jgi:hypothetical protein
MSVLVLRVVVVAAEFVALYLVIKSGARLELIALCVLSAFAVFSIAMVIVGNHLLEKPFRRGLVCVGKSVSPLLSVLAAIWIQDFAYPIGAYVPGSRLFLSCTLGLIVSLAVSTPFVYLANRQTRLAQVIFKTT